MTSTEAICLAAHDLRFQYPTSKQVPEKRYALNGVTVEIPLGRTTAVVGLSGSGKSTLLNVLGLLNDGNELESGSVRFAARDRAWNYAELEPGRRAELRRVEFGFVLQNAFLLSHFSCVDNVAMPLALAGVEMQERRGRAADLMLQAGLNDELLHRPARGVSGGEKQRLATLRALIHSPSVLFADEPLNNLDPQSAQQIIRLILDGWKNDPQSPATEVARRTLVIVSHNMDDLYEKIDWFYVMHQGRIVCDRRLSRSDVDRLGGVAALRRMMYSGVCE